MFCAHPADIRLTEQALARREAMGDTYIPPLKAFLLHCKTSTVNGCRLGYLRLRHSYQDKGREVLGAVVMLAPDKDEPIWQRVMQEVSAVLIDRPALIEALRDGDRYGAGKLLEDDLNLRLGHSWAAH